MTKEPEYHVGCGLFGIYAGTLMKPKKDGVIMWRKKSDVTEEAIHAVMQNCNFPVHCAVGAFRVCSVFGV